MANGEFIRSTTTIRDRVTADRESDFPAAAGRYHLYVSLACPWAHRTIIVRKLKGLEQAIGLTIVDPIRDDRGWAFTDEPDPINGFRFLREAYTATVPDYAGHVSVPVLWDSERRRIVNQESADIIVMLNSVFDEFAQRPELDLYPAEHREEIDALNRHIYETVNNGVYRSGFARTQDAYDRAVAILFEALDELDERLSKRRYLVSDQPTLADWRLFTTLIRFDPVYHGHFKCNIRRLCDYPSLWSYTLDLLSVPGVRETVDLDQIKRHYYMTHGQLNPLRIVPAGPEIDYDAAHGREALSSS